MKKLFFILFGLILACPIVLTLIMMCLPYGGYGLIVPSFEELEERLLPQGQHAIEPEYTDSNFRKIEGAEHLPTKKTSSKNEFTLQQNGESSYILSGWVNMGSAGEIEMVIYDLKDPLTPINLQQSPVALDWSGNPMEKFRFEYGVKTTPYFPGFGMFIGRVEVYFISSADKTKRKIHEGFYRLWGDKF